MSSILSDRQPGITDMPADMIGGGASAPPDPGMYRIEIICDTPVDHCTVEEDELSKALHHDDESSVISPDEIESMYDDSSDLFSLGSLYDNAAMDSCGDSEDTIAFFDDPKQMYRIEIICDTPAANCTVEEEHDEVFHYDRRSNIVSLDEIESMYDDSGNPLSSSLLSGNAAMDSHRDDESTIDPYEKPKKQKQKKTKQRKADINKEFLDALWGKPHSDEDDIEDEGVTSSEVASTRKNRMLSEYDLYRILISKFTFGCYGSSLYVRNFDGVYSEVNTATIEKLLMYTLTEEQQAGFMIGKSNAVRARLLASPEVRANQLIFPKTKVLFTNGCWDIDAKVPAIQLDSDFFITRINARYLPHKKLKCPYFDEYLETSSGGDESIKERICAMLGYLLLPGYPGKKILVLGTAKNSGKSMISRFFQRLVGPDLVCGQTPFDLKENHALSEFSGKIANMAMDIPATIITPASIAVLKAISGGDMISINPKGRDRRSQICYTKQVLGTNASLKLQQFDEAFWERVEIIPYKHSIAPDDRIDDLEEMLMLERDAIVTKCMKAARKLINDGYCFPYCPDAEEMKSSWIGWRSQAKIFLQTHCVAEEGSFTASTPLYDAYLQYCQENNLPYGSMTGFIILAKQIFPSNGNPHPMINGTQLRGLPNVRFIGELK